MKQTLRRIIPVVVILAILSYAFYYLNTVSAEEDGPLQASGTVEAVQLTIAPELGGRIIEVLVREGERVEAGQLLVQLDDTLLQAQLHQAEAALSVARANYDLVAAGMTSEQQQAGVAAASLELVAAQQALDTLYDNAELAAAQTLQAVATAENAVDDAGQRLTNLQTAAEQFDIDQAYANLVLAKDQLDKARDDFEPWENKPEDNVTRATFQSKLAQAQKVYDAAVTRYNNMTGTANALDIAQAEADLALAEARLADLKETYEVLKDGPDPDDVVLAEARIANAEAQLALAEAGSPTAEQLAVAQAQVDSAQSNLEAIRIQIEKMKITAPSTGTVLTRLVEPGEIARPNVPLLTLARLDDLTITVYVPENEYGAVRLGQSAGVYADSFPGETFEAVVTFIADEAEFTPRNVQTQEGRQSTVFAVRLSVSNSDTRLKPGMPADVVFGDR